MKKKDEAAGMFPFIEEELYLRDMVQQIMEPFQDNSRGNFRHYKKEQ